MLASIAVLRALPSQQARGGRTNHGSALGLVIRATPAASAVWITPAQCRIHEPPADTQDSYWALRTPWSGI
jgi:hypothetical protein